MPRPEPAATGRSLRAQVLLPFAIGAALLVTAVGTVTTVVAMQGAEVELAAHAAAVRSTVLEALERRQGRLEADAQLVAEDSALVRALHGGKVTELSRTMIPLGSKRELDDIAVHDEQNRTVLRNGRTAWDELPVVTRSAEHAAVGIRDAGPGAGDGWSAAGG